MALADDARWENWCADFDDVEREVISLFHTRWMWRAITGLMNNGVPNKQYTVVIRTECRLIKSPELIIALEPDSAFVAGSNIA